VEHPLALFEKLPKAKLNSMDLLTKQTPKAFRKPVGLEVKLLQAASYNHWTVFFYILVVGDVCELRKEVERTEMAIDGLNIAGKLRELTNRFY
jgi:hypothetical protein